MKVTQTFGLVLFGIGILSCAVVFGQGQETAKQPVNAPLQELVVQDGHQRLIGFANYQSQSTQLAHQYIKAEKDDEKKDIRKKLADVLAKQFDAQVEKQQKELADLEKQIANLKALLKKRTDAKTTIIDRRMDQLIQDAEGLGWNAPGDSNLHWFQQANPYSNFYPPVEEKKP